MKKKNAIKERLAIIESLVALEDIDDDDDIKEIVKQIRAFYNRANESHIGAALRMDNALLLACSKKASIIYSALKNAKQVLESGNNVESLIRMSKDPLMGLKLFSDLLSKANDDLEKSKQEIETRLNNASESDNSDINEEYSSEREELAKCREILEEVKN